MGRAPDCLYGVRGVCYSRCMSSNVERDAPAFDPERSDYPLGGTKTGPIWRAAWDVLSDEIEHMSGADLVADILERVPDAHPETARLILYRAAKAGILEAEIRPGKDVRGTTRNITYYRIKR